MPPKSHPKAVESRDRKAIQSAAQTAAADKAAEDAKWRDHDATKARTEARRDARDDKRASVADRKAENRRLTAEDEAEITSYAASKTGNKKAKNAAFRPKVSRAMLEVQKLEREKESRKQAALAAAQQGGSIAQADLPSENPNHIAARLASEGVAQAANVDEAIAVLGNGKGAATTTTFPKFLDSRMEDVKRENPGMRLSQLTELIRKEWKRSAANPKNQ